MKGSQPFFIIPALMVSMALGYFCPVFSIAFDLALIVCLVINAWDSWAQVRASYLQKNEPPDATDK